MEDKEILARKTLDFLLKHGDKSDFNLMISAINDYEAEGYDFSSYRQRVEELRGEYSK